MPAGEGFRAPELLETNLPEIELRAALDAFLADVTEETLALVIPRSCLGLLISYLLRVLVFSHESGRQGHQDRAVWLVHH